MKQNPIKREAIEHLYAYSAIKGALMSGEDEAAEREEIESAAFGQAREGPPAKTGANSDVTLRTVMVRIAGKAHKIAVDTKARLWINAIESAWAELLTYEPEIAELMEMTFHLRSGEGKRSGRMYVQARVCDKLHISDRTYYAWRNLAVNTVIYHYTTAQRKIIDTYLQQIF